MNMKPQKTVTEFLKAYEYSKYLFNGLLATHNKDFAELEYDLAFEAMDKLYKLYNGSNIASNTYNSEYINITEWIEENEKVIKKQIYCNF